MVPKLIHYIWVGNAELPPLYKECVSTWHVILPEFDILFWDENKISNTFTPSELLFYNKMLSAKKYAFAVDYIRCLILERFGGVYLDADIEMIKDLSSLNEGGNYLGMESSRKISCGVLAFSKNNWFVAKLKEKVEAANGLVEITKLSTEVLSERFGVLDLDLKESLVLDDITIYPKHYFYPYNPYDEGAKIDQLMFKDIKPETYCIHHWAKSWNYSMGELMVKGIKKLLVKKKNV
ncbi:glycosyltransferase family 32 protein [Citrobacter portucalensis]|uniref:glycosyltransferase family 32 protein n=1 Tax=Citrobacter portucalensis TaxID=1639133 RepID=UPI00301B8769